MAGSFSDYLENKVMDQWFGATATTVPGTVWVALYTTAPGDAGGGTEVSGNAYVRASVVNNKTNFGAASGGTVQNAVAINFAAATGGNWGTVVAFGILDSNGTPAGNLLAWADLTTNKVISAGDTASFAINALTISLS